MNKAMNFKDHILCDLYFVTSTVVDWVDIFTRPKYKHIVVDSLVYCQQHKGLDIYAWVLMTNHIHMIAGTRDGVLLSDILRDFKKFTNRRILSELENDQQESRRDWMLDRFQFAAANDRKIEKFHFWQGGNHVEDIWSVDFFKQKLNYIHQNPVRQELVAQPHEYLYSSAIDYAGGRGLLKVEVISNIL